MNTILKVGAASAMTLGAVAAHASIAAPSSGSSDAILFAQVVNAAQTATVASYAGDTGLSISSIVAGLSGTTSVLGSDSNFQALFAADNVGAGDVLYYAVLGGQYTGATSVQNFKTPGIAQFLTTTPGDSTQSLAKDNVGSLVHFAGINTDISNVNSNSGGANSVEGTSTTSAGIWDVNNIQGLSLWDGGATTNYNTIGSTQKLFYVTGGPKASLTAPVAYSEVATVSLSSAGLTVSGLGSTTPPPPVPLPAAVWLFGSGLLGLTGIARRKAKV